MNNVFITSEGKEKGIFFRFPIQMVMYNWYDEGVYFPTWFNWILNIFRIGKAKEFMKLDNAAGFRFYEFASPIYFSRDYRTLEYLSSDLKISSYGYGKYKDSDSCLVEYTKMTFTINGEKIVKKTVSRGKYNFCYQHKVESFIKRNINSI